jgi:hypothetical protein
MGNMDFPYPNPFYLANEEFVKNNFKYAKECYDKILDNFISAYCITESIKLGIIKSDNPDELKSNKNDILNAIYDGKITPLNLKELENFSI